jgi:hypothetical protein
MVVLFKNVIVRRRGYVPSLADCLKYEGVRSVDGEVRGVV